jgi:hypothetical protein
VTSIQFQGRFELMSFANKNLISQSVGGVQGTMCAHACDLMRFCGDDVVSFTLTLTRACMQAEGASESSHLFRAHVQ